MGEIGNYSGDLREHIKGKWLYIDKRGEGPSKLYSEAVEKLSGVKVFDRLKENFRKIFRGDWRGIKPDEYDRILQKTQAVEAEMRAGMDLVEEYGAKGWEIEKELYWNNGRNKVEIDMLNIEKGILGEIKSGIPKGVNDLEGWIKSDKFIDWIDARVTGLRKNGMYDKIKDFRLVITEDMLGDMSVEEVEALVSKVLKEEGVNWNAKVIVIRW